MSLEIRGIWKSFAAASETQHVLRGVDLVIPEREFVSLIGHSGCGKSTLLNIIGGLSTADAGVVRLDGAIVTEPGPDRAMVFQNYSLLPRLSLYDNVVRAVEASDRRRTKARAAELSERYLRAVGLWEQREKRPAQVSGGMQQRCAVARAFAVEPRVLLLDEPFGALDALTRATLQAELTQLWQSETATEIVLMVTHGVDEAALLSDRVVVMGNGPGPSIVEEIEVTIERPRDVVAHRAQLHDYEVRLLDRLRKDHPSTEVRAAIIAA